MQSKFKLYLAIGILLSAFSGCGTLRPVTSWPATPSATDTAIPPSATKELAPQITSLKMIDAKDGWAWTNAGQMLRTTDGGQTWMDRTPGEAVGPEGSFFLDSHTAWQPILLKSSSMFGLLDTTDGGKSWTEFPFGEIPSNFRIPWLDGIQFADDLYGWLRGDTTLFLTEVGGKTWTQVH